MSANNPNTSGRLPGILFVLTSGCCWGFHGILIKYALGFGASFLQVFLFETVVATFFFSLFASRFFRKLRPRTWKQWLVLSAMSLSAIGVGYFLFLAFSLGPVAIGATLMFMYLPVVYGYSLTTGHQKFSAIKLISILFVLGGAVLTTEILFSLQEEGVLPAACAALAASLCYALVFILTPSVAGYSTAEFRSFSASFIGLAGTLLIFAFVPKLWFPLTGNLLPLFGIAVALGVVGQTLPVITLMKGLPLTGSSLGGVLASIELPIAVFASALLLGESFNLGKVVGVALVLSGIVLYNLFDNRPSGKTSKITQDCA